jgi:hypothetical protein
MQTSAEVCELMPRNLDNDNKMRQRFFKDNFVNNHCPMKKR